MFCDNNECGPGQVCCFNRFTQGVDFCAATGTCPDGNEWTEISCNTADDCNGGVCCGTYDQGWIQVECAQQCNGGNDLVMCFGDPGACMPGETCTPSQALGDAFCGN